MVLTTSVRKANREISRSVGRLLERISKTISELSGRGSFPLIVSKRRLRLVERIQAAREQQHSTAPNLLFGPRPLIVCGMPVKRPPAGHLVHRRRNGRFFLEIAAHPEYGLPFGQDRLVLIWVATLAVRQKNRTVRFDSAAQVLHEFGLPADGPHYRRMIEAFQRVFTSTIFFGTSDGRADAVDSARVHFFDALDLWFCPHRTRSTNDNMVTLSEAFWNELRAHPIPIQRDAVRALASSPGCLDLYLWLRWRGFGLQRPQVIPITGPNGLAAQLGPDEYGRERDFRRILSRWLDRIRQVWPTCRCRLDRQGLILSISPQNPQTAVD